MNKSRRPSPRDTPAPKRRSDSNFRQGIFLLNHGLAVSGKYTLVGAINKHDSAMLTLRDGLGQTCLFSTLLGTDQLSRTDFNTWRTEVGTYIQGYKGFLSALRPDLRPRDG
jgi:hypothetical protein